MMSGVTPGLLAGEHRAGAAEAGENLIEDQQRAAAIRHRAQALQRGGIVEAHAARALHQRLDDHAGKAMGMPLQPASPGLAARLVGRQIEHDMFDGSKPRNALCMPVPGSLTAIAPVVSP